MGILVANTKEDQMKISITYASGFYSVCLNGLVLITTPSARQASFFSYRYNSILKGF